MIHGQKLKILMLLVSCCLQVGTLMAQGKSIPKTQEVKALEEAIPEELPEGVRHRYPFFNGISISVDLFDPLLRAMYMKHGSYEAQVMADLHHRFFPMAAFGMGEGNDASDNGNDFDTGSKQEHTVKTKLSPFGKIGFAYNLDFNSTHPDDFYLLFARYGLSMTHADISNLYYTDGVWNTYGPVSLLGQSYTTQWIEFGGMIKVQLWKRIAMGWDLYFKFKLTESGTEQGEPFYVAGYGESDSHFGFAFRLYYDIF